MRGLFDFGVRHGEAAPLVSLDSKMQALQVPSGKCKGLGELCSKSRAGLKASCKGPQDSAEALQVAPERAGAVHFGVRHGEAPPPASLGTVQTPCKRPQSSSEACRCPEDTAAAVTSLRTAQAPCKSL